MTETQTVRVSLSRENEKVHFIGEQEQHTIHIDGPPEIGGDNKGFRPMQVLLYALGGCAVFDFVSLLYKQIGAVEDVIVEVEGVRKQEGSCKPFVSISLCFIVIGREGHALIEKKSLIEHCAKLAVQELCSVGATLRKETKIDYRVELQ